MKKLMFLFLCVFLFAQDVIVVGDNADVEVFNDNFAVEKRNIKVAVVMDKKKFFRYIPLIMNSLNSYFIYKNDDYELRLFDKKNNLEKITQDFSDIIYFTTNKEDIYKLKDYNATFYVPTFNSYDFNETFNNIYFGLIDFKSQVNKLAQYITDDYAIAINSKGTIPKKLLQYEMELNITIDFYNFPRVPYYRLRNKFVFLNTSASKTAQILSHLTYKNIITKLQLSSQINYSPLLITITQPQDVEKLIIANSILKVPMDLEDINQNLYTDIKFNWLNYAISVLANKIYNLQTQSDEYYMNDFNLYIFNHQINYKTKLYKIINGAFKSVE